ncbi:hypothetical protein [Limnoglobus roseus]|uniref:Uncharacterized protein n=1 Tax=Limnoglobus roseus TaxID=2598579 RepID=A0A5C1AGK0_9BACT|nr:hypothetical protein [Limnoglobus roseus]QEL17373.1 hypothetical protein PX52LOC_04358 [Limnoglobus roseus]
MPSETRTLVESAARELIRLLARTASPTSVRVTEAGSGLACMIQVWDPAAVMPTAAGEKRDHHRAGCKQAILDAIRAAGEPLTRKQIVKLFRDNRAGHGPGTVAKALADLTKDGTLVNPKDKRGYRLAEWPKPQKGPTLFDGVN